MNSPNTRLGLALLFALTGSAGADVIFVSASNCPGPGSGTSLDPYCSIQDAIDAASAGDVVQVSAGTYVEAIDLSGKAITVVATLGPDETIIDGAGAEHVVLAISGEGPDTVLDGFTITGGDATSARDPQGGGMRITESSPTVVNCVFAGNRANRGGGVSIVQSAASLTNCVFTGNFAGFQGGGVWAAHEPTITNCTFSANTSFNGGGLFAQLGSNVTVANCVFRGNTVNTIEDLSSGGLSVTSSNVEGGWPGAGNIDADPLFADPDGADNVVGTTDDDVHLLAGSSCIDRGSDAATPSGVVADYDGDVRNIDGDSDGDATVDMGADEVSFVDCNANGITDALDIAMATSSDDDGDGVPDECEFSSDFEPVEAPAAGAADHEAVGDLDLDGFDDVVIVLAGSDQVQVFLNQGTDVDGNWLGFTGLAPIAVGSNPNGVALGLFDGDAILDLAVANTSDDDIDILLGDGAGGFTFDTSVAVGDQPRGLATALFSGDALTDIAVANMGDDTVQILTNVSPLALGGAETAWAASAAIPTGDMPISLEPEDVDDDKDVDLVAANHGSDDVTVVLFQRGIPSGQLSFGVGAGPVDVATGDLDGDGLPEIATANGADASVTILLNEGGTFASAGPAKTIGANPASVEMGDLDGDGDLDLAIVAENAVLGPVVQVVANHTIPGEPIVVSPPLSHPIGADPNFIAAADLDGDAVIDLVTVNADDTPEGGSVTGLVSILCVTGTVAVPGDYPTIQEAIDAMCGAGEIVVAPGTYVGTIDFKGKPIAVRSSAGPAVTIIDGGGAGHVVLSASGEGPETVFEGFTITGGDATSAPQPNGGGMLIASSSPTVTSCVFAGNAAVRGGGVHASGSPTELTNCVFTGNVASMQGGGVWAANDPAFVNCTFSENSGGTGGALLAHIASTVTVANCIFWGNAPSTITDLSGGGLAVTSSNVEGGWPGAGNIDADPLFADADGADDVAGTIDDDVHLLAGSPCRDAGDDATVPPAITTDYEGDDRFIDGDSDRDVTVDMGADEAIVDCNGNGVADAEDIALGTSSDDDESGVPDECECPADFDGTTDIGFGDLTSLLIHWGACPAEPAACPWDIDTTGDVGFSDLTALLLEWGECEG